MCSAFLVDFTEREGNFGVIFLRGHRSRAPEQSKAVSTYGRPWLPRAGEEIVEPMTDKLGGCVPLNKKVTKYTDLRKQKQNTKSGK